MLLVGRDQVDMIGLVAFGFDCAREISIFLAVVVSIQGNRVIFSMFLDDGMVTMGEISSENDFIKTL